MWPEIEASVWDILQEEASSPTTPAEWLIELATHWPGYQVRSLLVANPNLPQDQIIELAPLFPRAFLSNPALPQWFAADPNWLPRWAAHSVLVLGRREPEWPAVAEQYADLVALLYQRCAGMRL